MMGGTYGRKGLTILTILTILTLIGLTGMVSATEVVCGEMTITGSATYNGNPVNGELIEAYINSEERGTTLANSDGTYSIDVYGCEDEQSDYVSFTIDSCEAEGEIPFLIPPDDYSFTLDLTASCGTSCDGYSNSVDCEDDSDCDWCGECDSSKQNTWGAGTCVDTGTSCGYECVDGECGAECDSNDDCTANTCSQTYNDYCNNNQLVEYDSDKIQDSTTVDDSCENTCESDCACTDCSTDCSAPATNTYCVQGVCGATDRKSVV